ncbi:Retron-type RNA-directed DNA polymerase [Collimonas arenae]|uniref:RNA-directed DNA polymerase n=1 Tax=Collimonas arenae TaxID=279058 RepID=A0A0A1FCI1_9BURK|nr:reverse transcriptase domain-containing protein [Collimonas arenae]AIY40562.1 Retron-type RNA-directed DNA polymerase [Collimonas arenae]
MLITLSALTPPNFLDLKSFSDLALFFGIPSNKLGYLLYALQDSDKYKSFNVPKKTGGTRQISEPHPLLKKIQRKLADSLLELYKPKQSVHGYLKDKSIVSNAKMHLRKRYLLNFDLADFFTSINFGRVRGLFLNHPFNFPQEVATALARISTKENSLPQGAPSSPVISNFMCWGLDNYLRKFCYQLGCTYTRYADDISISTNRENFPTEIANVKHDPYSAVISEILTTKIEQNGFTINNAKTRFSTPRQSQVVTGLKVNEFANVSRKYVRNLRAMLHAWEKFGLDKAESEFREKYVSKHRAPFLPPVSFKQVLHGKLTFLRSVRGPNDDIYQKLLGRYSLVADLRRLTKFGFPKQINRALWILESDLFEDDYYQGTGFCLDGIGIVTCAHVLKPGTKARRIYNHLESLNIEIVERNDALDYAIIKVIGGVEEVSLIADLDFNHQLGGQVRTIGFPAHDGTASVAYEDGVIVQSRYNAAGQKWFRVNTNIVAGSSGGPVLNSEMKVIGIVAYGATNLSGGGDPINSGYIPIQCLNGPA